MNEKNNRQMLIGKAYGRSKWGLPQVSLTDLDLGDQQHVHRDAAGKIFGE